MRDRNRSDMLVAAVTAIAAGLLVAYANPARPIARDVHHAVADAGKLTASTLDLSHDGDRARRA